MSLSAAAATNFAMKAGLLVFTARLGFMPMEATIDPSAPVSTAAPAFAHWLGASAREGGWQRLLHHRDITLDGASFELRQVAIVPAPGHVSMQIGADILRRTEIALDFVHGRLSIPTPAEARKLKVSMVALDIETMPDGCVSILGRAANGQKLRAAVIGAAGVYEGSPVQFAVETISLPAARLTSSSRCPDSDVAIDWSSFAGRKILLDLAHAKLWISQVRAENP